MAYLHVQCYQALVSPLEMESNGFKGFVINTLTILHGTNMFSITRLTRNGM